MAVYNLQVAAQVEGGAGIQEKGLQEQNRIPKEKDILNLWVLHLGWERLVGALCLPKERKREGEECQEGLGILGKREVEWAFGIFKAMS